MVLLCPECEQQFNRPPRKVKLAKRNFCSRKCQKTGVYQGERNCGAKLSWVKVADIRENYNPHKTTVRMLSHKYSVSEGTVWDVIMRRTWIMKGLDKKYDRF